MYAGCRRRRDRARVVLLVTAVCASWLPAHRASRVDPWTRRGLRSHRLRAAVATGQRPPLRRYRGTTRWRSTFQTSPHPPHRQYVSASTTLQFVEMSREPHVGHSDGGVAIRRVLSAPELCECVMVVSSEFESKAPEIR